MRADGSLACHVRAKTFQDILKSLVELVKIVEPQTKSDQGFFEHSVEVDGLDQETLLVSFLMELINCMDCQGGIVSAIKIETLTDQLIKARLKGVKLDRMPEVFDRINYDLVKLIHAGGPSAEIVFN